MRAGTYAYMAGLMDGEGHITLTKSQPGPNATRTYLTKKGIRKCRRVAYDTWQFTLNIGMTSTDDSVIKWIFDNFGGSVYTDKRPHQANWRCAKRWRIIGKKRQEFFLLGILPYLVIKRKQALLALSFIRQGDIPDQKMRLEYFEQFKMMNRRGVSPETNTPSTSEDVKIESGLHSDMQSDAVVTQ